jgi:choline dehydrogenase
MLYANPKVNWCYESAPEPHLNNRRLFQPRGKVLGGTGAINGMIYMRGQPQDFDGWEAAGCTGWGWDGVSCPFSSPARTRNGAPTSFTAPAGRWQFPISGPNMFSAKPFTPPQRRLGVPRNDDFNGARQEGTGYVQTTTKKGMRWSTAAGYLRGPARTKIDLKLNAMVERITLRPAEPPGCAGPKDRSGTHQANARREVILSGGTFNSPQLLQISGIGPGALLRDQGIEVHHDLPGVGENLQDHFGIGAEYRSTVHSTVNDLYNNKLKGGLQLCDT